MTIKAIPEKVLQRFKAYCNLHGKPMNQVIIEFMDEKGKQVKLESEK